MFSGSKRGKRAKLLMDIALVNPEKVPSTQDYQVAGKENSKIMNEKYRLTGTNKEIPEHYYGVEFRADSPTAQRLNNSLLHNYTDKNQDLVCKLSNIKI